MKYKPIVTLITDFGYKDPFVGIIKGIILGISPEVNLIDITHGIGKYNIKEAALAIGMSYKHFPTRTIHLVVADPGVGSQRRPIIVTTDDHTFVGPDNGVFSVIYNENERARVFQITSKHYFMPDRSYTFHGRDIFAPAAAWLSKGIDSSNFGDEITDYSKLIIPSVSMPAKTAVEGEVIYMDHFGNAITNIRIKDINALRETSPNRNLRVIVKGKQTTLKQHYTEAEDKDLYAVINSMDFLELFVCRGNASNEFDIKVGDTVGVILQP